MIVGVHYQLFDLDPEIFIIDTDLLEKDNHFESDLFIDLESDEQFIQVDAEQYFDDYGNIQKAKTDKLTNIFKSVWVR